MGAVFEIGFDRHYDLLASRAFGFGDNVETMQRRQGDTQLLLFG